MSLRTNNLNFLFYLCVAEQNSTAGCLCHQRKNVWKLLKGLGGVWTATNCKTKLRKMSSIISIFTFSLVYYFSSYWKSSGRPEEGGRTRSLPPLSSEKLPFYCRHSPIFWHPLTLRMRVLWNYNRTRSSWRARRSVLQTSFLLNEKLNLRWSHTIWYHPSVEVLFHYFFVIEHCNLLFWVTCFASNCLAFFLLQFLISCFPEWLCTPRV